MKTCSKCKESKNISDFSRASKRKDGLSPWCKRCAAQANQARYQEIRETRLAGDKLKRNRNRLWVLNYLLSHPCVDCEEADPIVLDFDHVRGQKTRDVSSMVASTTSLKRIEEEIAKCEVRCSNCHRKVTVKRAGGFRSTDPSLWESFAGTFVVNKRIQ